MGFRAWLLSAAFLLAVSAPQQPGTLRIRVTVVDANQQLRPVPRHALLISVNPTSAAPQRVVTAIDGVAEVRLRAGNYTIESEEPLIFQGKIYEWTQTLDVPPGQTSTLELNAANAAIESASERQPSGGTAGGNVSALLIEWQRSVVSIWTATKRGAGFVADARGLIVTNQRLIGTETSVEVQLSATEKIAGRVLASDAERNVAIIRVDAKAIAAARPMPLAPAEAARTIAGKDKLFSITAPTDDDKSLISGVVSRVNAREILSNLPIDDVSLGAPVFTGSGEVVAITTPDDSANSNSDLVRAIRIEEARIVLAAADKHLSEIEAPSAARLPIEGQPLFPDDPLRAAAEARKGSLAPYRVAAADFDVSLITPLLLYSARRSGGERSTGGGRGGAARDPVQIEADRQAIQDFGNWWEYARNDLPVLMVRATPKMVEPFWKSVLRGAAQTQGVSLPPIKRIKAGFARMRMFCGATEVTPIHPFKIEHRLGEAEAVYEGFYIFDPSSVGPHCGTVRLTLYSDKAPDKGDTRAIDAKILQQIWTDFAPYRARG